MQMGNEVFFLFRCVTQFPAKRANTFTFFMVSWNEPFLTLFRIINVSTMRDFVFDYLSTLGN